MSTHEELHAKKADVRTRAREARCALEPDACVGLAVAAAERLLSLPEVAAARTVMAYAANAEELDPAPALAELRAAGVAIVMPRIEEPGVLGLHLVAASDPLEPGPLGIHEPLESAPRADAHAIDVVIVPGVAFDEAGRRLGYGGGYYDRLLPRLRGDCLRIGYAYDEQVVEAIPVAEHDEHVHVVVTPTRVMRTDRSAHSAGAGR